jgi:type VI secretion system secreted protein Hcp
MSDAFLKIEGIDGESSDSKHKDWIEVLSYGWGVSQPTSAASTAGSATSARASFGDLSITKVLDKSSPKLFLACASGEHLKKVTLELCRAAGDDKAKYMEYLLEEVVVSNVSIGGSGNDLPVESITFNYGSIKQNYYKTDRATGKEAGLAGSAGWSLTQNKKL